MASGRSLNPWVVLGVLVLVAGVALAGRIAWRRSSTPPAVLGTLPAFALQNQEGATFGAEQLRGKLWVANFIFTRCPTICPAFTRKMHGVQQRTSSHGADVRLVSFSVDPEFDTPEVLRAYAEKHGADQTRWHFLTGSAEAIRQTVVDGLKVSMGRSGPAEDLNSIFHGTHFVLVDRELRIRGYYRSEDAEQVDLLLRDIDALTRD